MPYPLSKRKDLLQKLEDFQWATSLDLNMGYYHTSLTANASRMCTVVFPWVKYAYLRLPMGLCNSPDNFHEKMNDLMEGLHFARVYLDNILVISKVDLDKHLHHVEQVLTRLSAAGLKVCMFKSKICRDNLEYLVYHISRNGIQPMVNKVEAILAIQSPKTRN